jgi:tRNA-Thr(GGU) m(6)t(6)A37 methyltransferase TsaA
MNDPSPHYTIVPIGWVESSLKERAKAPRQGSEGAPDAWLLIRPEFAEGLHGIKLGQEIVVLTLLHEARRDLLKVRPRDDEANPLTGVFVTRSPDRPNPIGLHRTKILRIVDQCRLLVRGLEAIDGTPVIDIKPVLDSRNDS